MHHPMIMISHHGMHLMGHDSHDHNHELQLTAVCFGLLPGATSFKHMKSIRILADASQILAES